MSVAARIRSARIPACAALALARLVLATLPLASVACSGGAKPARPPVDVSGWYVRDVGDGREVIDVRPNGAYVHVLTIRGAGARADEGRWGANGDSALTLRSFRDAAEIGHGAPPGDSVRAAIRPAPEGELRLELPGDTASFLRRLRYGKQRGG